MQNMLFASAAGAYTPGEVTNTSESMDFAMMSFSFMPDSMSFGGGNSERRNLLSQKNAGLRMLGLKSGSAYENMDKLMFVFFGLFGIYLIIVWMLIIANYYFKDTLASKILKGAFDIFTCYLFIRLFILAYFFIILCALAEISINNVDADDEGSYSFAMIVLILAEGFLIFTAVQWLLFLSPSTFKKLDRVNEAFRGTKDVFLAKSLPLVYLVRSNIFAITLTVFAGSEVANKLAVFVSFQALFILYIIAIRPFKSLKDFIIELIISVFFFGALIALFFLDSAEKWTQATIFCYLGAILLAILLTTIVTIGKDKFLIYF